MTESFRHDPVMRDEIVAIFAGIVAGTVLDATVGGAGHAEALLDADPGIRLLGLDQDPLALEAAAARLGRFGDRVRLVHARFDSLADVLASQPAPFGGEGLAGALFDLGVSSPQLDLAHRGFSYRLDAALDMRMDTTQTRTAADVVNDTAVAELERILRVYGDEPNARRLARAIAAARPLRTTGELTELIDRTMPAPARRRGGHPAKRTFQALRIEVNRELDVLPPALDDAVDALVPGGRIAVLSYHSGEDRIVKACFRRHETGGCTCPPQLGCRCGARRTLRPLWRGAHRPTAVEIAANPRAQSARLRAATKLEND